MPINFQHVGLIRASLSDAIIVHEQRHPAATCWSIYQNFLGKADHAYSFDMDELGQYYRSYSELKQHWQRVPTEYQSVRYKSLVSDQEAVAPKLLSCCEFDWDDACLDFHQTSRSVRTLSAAQVRRPIYTDALAQWQHYSSQLEPLLKALGETVKPD